MISVHRNHFSNVKTSSFINTELIKYHWNTFGQVPLIKMWCHNNTVFYPLISRRYCFVIIIVIVDVIFFRFFFRDQRQRGKRCLSNLCNKSAEPVYAAHSNTVFPCRARAMKWKQKFFSHFKFLPTQPTAHPSAPFAPFVMRIYAYTVLWVEISFDRTNWLRQVSPGNTD